VSFVRAELAARLKPWREAAVWAAGLAFGVWLMLEGVRGWAPLPLVSGFVLGGASLGLLLAALRRIRLRAATPDEGLVLIKEGRIGYLGPRGGGFLDLDELRVVDIVSDGRRAAWSLGDVHGEALRIPMGARGADAIYDALGPFAQLDDEALRAGMATRQPGRFPLWQRPAEAGGLRAEVEAGRLH
jgi:hypothetical protein